MKGRSTNWIRGKQTPKKGTRWLDDSIGGSGHEGKRLAILETAARLFNERGYEGVSIDDIAAALNVTKPSIYYYVGNKEEILVFIRRLAATNLTEGFDDQIAKNRTGIELLAFILQRYGVWSTSEIGRCALRLITVKLSPKNSQDLRDVERGFERDVRMVFERGMEDGTIKRCNVSMVMMALFGSLNWLAFWYDPQRANLSPAEISRLFTEIFLCGIGAGNPPPIPLLSSLEGGLAHPEDETD